MIEITVNGTEEALEFLEEVARAMVILFPITMDEAVGRINRKWRQIDLLDPLAVDMLLHEEAEAWAKHVFYGADSFWWVKNEEELEPLPYSDGEGDLPAGDAGGSAGVQEDHGDSLGG